MYRYKPKGWILQKIAVRLNDYSARWNRLRELLDRFGLKGYVYVNIVLTYYPRVEFYSPKLLLEVPVNGYLLPATMFDVEVV